jgi:hypothetical protein
VAVPNEPRPPIPELPIGHQRQKAAASASIACASRRRAPERKTTPTRSLPVLSQAQSQQTAITFFMTQ